ncbi:uncharacterized protein [Ptychodera flava]|uniref:uncharacterized protein isoform X1 n=1 Tax=Ptychodera flava TaxID=63121 RepID=UPI00396A296C
MGYLMLSFLCLCVFDFKSVYTAPTAIGAMATTEINYIGGEDDMEYQEDFNSGDQWENCASDEYQCDNDECIPSIYRCDGVNDCEDTSDELHCAIVATIETATTTTTTVNNIGEVDDIDYLEDFYSGDQWENCASDEYQCDNDECIPSIYKCDGVNDCEDNSDELDCEITSTTASESASLSYKFEGEKRHLPEKNVERISTTAFQSSMLSYKFEGTIKATTSLPSLAPYISSGSALFLPPGNSLVIESPNYPNPYDNYLERTWVISTDEQYHFNASFNSFDTEERFDYVYVGEGFNPGDKVLLNRHSGSYLPDDFVCMQAGMWITFLSDCSLTGSGFQLTVTSVRN